MRRATVTGFVLAAVFGTVSMASAQEAPPRGERGARPGPEWQGRRHQAPGGLGFLLKDIELSDDQKAQLKEINQKHRQSGGAAANRSELQEQARAARARGDTAALRRMRAEHVAAMQKHREQFTADVRALLTPAQREVFERNLAEAQERMDKRRQDGKRRSERRGTQL